MIIIDLTNFLFQQLFNKLAVPIMFVSRVSIGLMYDFLTKGCAVYEK